MSQNTRKQNEKKTTSTNKTREKEKLKRDRENKSQTQSSDIIIANEHIRQENLITRAQSSIAFTLFKKLKRNRTINNFEFSNNKRRKRYITADVKKFKKNIFFFFKQIAFISKTFHQLKKITKFFQSDVSSIILHSYDC